MDVSGRVSRRATLSLVLLLVLAVPGPAAGAVGGVTARGVHHASVRADAARPATSGSVAMTRTTHLSLTPSDPGDVGVVVRFDVPDNVRSIAIRPPDPATVQRTDGFRRNETGAYEWTGDVDAPSLTLTYRVNRTSRTRQGSAATPRSGSLAFADAGPWAITPVPGFTTRWTWVGSPDVRLERRAVVDGEGVVGTDVAYLGPSRVYERSAGGQRLRLVVPRAADLVEPPDAVLDSLADASRTLGVGARDPSVMLVAAPTGVDWVSRGLEHGGADAWVVADARLDEPDNVWLHEYVHTRQAFETTADTRWLVEATAEYYGALLTLDQGRIDFPTFREHLELGTRYDDVVLGDPDTWRDGANYFKGALVAGTVDRHLRAETDGSARLTGVLARLNVRDAPVTRTAFLDAVAAAAPAVRDPADRYAYTRATPDPWGAATHARVFGSDPARMRYALNGTDAYRVTGRYRNATLDGPPRTLVTDETLTLSPSVTNVGGESGTYDVSLLVGSEAVAHASGSLDAGETTTVSLTHAFDAPGTYTVRVGHQSFEVAVDDPARATVTDLSVPSTLRPNQTATVRATVQNDATRPGRATVQFRVDGATVSTRHVALPEGGERTVSTTVRFADEGRHTVAAGSQSATVEVRAGSGTPAVPGVPGVPGFGVPATAAALAALTLALTAAALRRGD